MNAASQGMESCTVTAVYCIMKVFALGIQPNTTYNPLLSLCSYTFDFFIVFGSFCPLTLDGRLVLVDEPVAAAPVAAVKDVLSALPPLAALVLAVLLDELSPVKREVVSLSG